MRKMMTLNSSARGRLYRRPGLVLGVASMLGGAAVWPATVAATDAATPVSYTAVQPETWTDAQGVTWVGQISVTETVLNATDNVDQVEAWTSAPTLPTVNCRPECPPASGSDLSVTALSNEASSLLKGGGGASGKFDWHCGWSYSWQFQQSGWSGEGTHITFDGNGHATGCQTVWVDNITPSCSGTGQCQQPSDGTIGNGTNHANPWYNQIVYYGCCSDTFMARFNMHADGSWDGWID